MPPTIEALRDAAYAAQPWSWLALTLVASFASFGLIALLRPWLMRIALAKLGPQSNHTAPTPAGAGLGVIAVFLAGTAVAFALWGIGPTPVMLALALGAAGLAGIGFLDDVTPLPIGPRLAAQGVAVGLVVLVLPLDVPPGLDLALRAGIAVGLLWFVNLTNFLDGIDLISAVQTLSVSVGVVAVVLVRGTVPVELALAAAVLAGAITGFAAWNTPPARLFLGDAGSVPLGLVLGSGLLLLAASGAVMAAVLLPLYAVADTTLTLVRRALNGEKVWKPHRGNFYQRAVRSGFSVREVVARVAAVNLGLVVLALMAETTSDPALRLAALGFGAALVAMLLLRFHTGKQDPP